MNAISGQKSFGWNLDENLPQQNLDEFVRVLFISGFSSRNRFVSSVFEEKEESREEVEERSIRNS